MDWSFLYEPATYVSLATLTLMEIVLGIDNIVFITILCGRLPPEWEHKARRVGIGIALISRMLLLGALNWVMHLNDKFLDLGVVGIKHAFSGRDLILLFGGLFLIGKATHEIYENVEHPEVDEVTADEPMRVPPQEVKKMLLSIMLQVIVLDVVFSLDSVITAVGMAKHLPVMAAAMIISVIFMMIFSNPVGDFVQKNPSVRVLALAFLVLIGVMLLADGMGQHVSKGYIYSAIGFSLFVEMVNLRRRKKESNALTPDAQQV